MSPKQQHHNKYQVELSFKEINLPPFEDILVVGSMSKQGRIGLSKTFDYLVPMSFDMIEIDEEDVSVVFINRKILKKMPLEKVMGILRDKIFPYVSKDEILKVDFQVTVHFESIEINKDVQ